MHAAHTLSDPVIRFACADEEVGAAHALLRRRIGARYVEDADGFRLSAGVETADWIPRLGLVYLSDGQGQPALVAAQLGGLLPAIAMLSLPYTTVAKRYEGQGLYLRLKRAMLAELAAIAAARGLPQPIGNVSEEAPGSAQLARKVGRGIATPLPVRYLQPAVHGLAEAPLVLTFEPFVSPPPRFGSVECARIVAAVYRGLYRIAAPEAHPTYRNVVTTIMAAQRDEG